MDSLSDPQAFALGDILILIEKPPLNCNGGTHGKRRL
jgi:hypothetical protein